MWHQTLRVPAAMTSETHREPENGDTGPCQQLPPLPLGQGFAMLPDVRIIDLTTSVAGPYATMLLADMGAEVIKVERPGIGDDARAWGPPFLDGQSLWFASINRNKRSLTLNLDPGNPEGHRLLLDLVSRADVVVTNQVPQVQAKLGTDYETLRQTRSDLIYAAITGFGLDGQRCDMPCYDLIAEGYSGVMDLTGELDGNPQKIGTPAADMLAGMDAAFAVAAALFRRSATGQGCCIDVSLVESMTRFMTPRIVSYLGSGELPRRSGARDSVIAIYQAFNTADEPMTLGLGSDAIWKRFWGAVGEPEVGTDQRFATNSDRRAAREELVSRIGDILQRKPRSHWLETFAAHKVPAGPINRLDQVTQDSALIDRGLFYRLEQQGLADVPQVNTGVRIDGRANAPRSAPPRLGADTDAILGEIVGLDEEAIRRLRDDRIV
jgi:crotonobetainyl-CoA:carnitine CoA-transferase CaiB-like acyl-CoA transferase